MSASGDHTPLDGDHRGLPASFRVWLKPCPATVNHAPPDEVIVACIVLSVAKGVSATGHHTSLG